MHQRVSKDDPVPMRSAVARSASESISVDLCVLGAGSGGLSVAAGAAQMGARVALVERDRMGGDCLNTGCVPSKSLIAAAYRAHAIRNALPFGIHAEEPEVAFGEVHDHIHEVIAGIAPHDSVERFEGLGVKVIRGNARFADSRTITVDTRRINARRFVVATGSRAAFPPVPGLSNVPYFTNETIFELDKCPAHLVVLGGGPIGVELAQAYRRLGAQVTLIERFQILPRDEPEAVDVVRQKLSDEGVDIVEYAQVSGAAASGHRVRLTIETGGRESRVVSGTHLLLAAGRQPNVEGLGLEEAGIAYGSKGITVDARLRTTNRRVFAIGDVTGGPQFTHIAGYQAGIVIRNALFGIPAKTDYRTLPWVTYTDPELAHVGLTEAAAREAGHDVSVVTEPFSANDRARAERSTGGLAKIIVGKRGAVLGATLVGSHAGELIGIWGLAIGQRLKLSAIAGMILPYPTFSEISKQTAGRYFTPTLYGARMHKLVRMVQRLLP